MYSAFGVEHGEFSKADKQPHQSSLGRKGLAVFAPEFHGPIAAKKGKRLRAFGNEAGGAYGGAFAGRVIGAATHSGALMNAGAIGGAAAGALAGLKRNERKGYLKPEEQ